MRKLIATALGVVAMLLAPASRAPAGAASGSAFDFEFPSIDGGAIKLADWRGKVLLVVNTASFCGYTRQYSALQELWSKYEGAGLVVLGVPSNDFGAQEPKAEGEIRQFCEGAFGVTFPLTKKQTVVGDGAHPFYKWAAQSVGAGGEPGWNFHKYLIGRDGRLLQSFSTQTTPNSADVVGWIEKALAEKSAMGGNAVQN
jgi:glutathione peroxidase